MPRRQRSAVKSIALESNMNDVWSLERVNFAGETRLTENIVNHSYPLPFRALRDEDDASSAPGSWRLQRSMSDKCCLGTT